MKKGDIVRAKGLTSSPFRPWNGDLCIVLATDVHRFEDGRTTIRIKHLPSGRVCVFHAHKFEEANDG